MAFVTRRMRCNQMQLCSSEADPRFTFYASWERAEHDADGGGSFAAVEMVHVGQAPINLGKAQ